MGGKAEVRLVRVSLQNNSLNAIRSRAQTALDSPSICAKFKSRCIQFNGWPHDFLGNVFIGFLRNSSKGNYRRSGGGLSSSQSEAVRTQGVFESVSI